MNSLASRKIIHIDMDAFYASVEQRDNPSLKNKPVIVGGRPDSRGVVAACSYEARSYGIHSAMPCSRAYKRCPHAHFIKPRMSRYREISLQIHAIFKQYTDLVEPLSLDEAFLDITSNHKGQDSATIIARQICAQIFEETGLTASAGVSCNKFVAKVASDLNKPNGISVIRPHEIPSFLSSLPIGKFFGVGKVTEKKMISLGIRTGADLKAHSREQLVDYFGKQGLFYYNIVRGKDQRPVKPERVRKSIGAERTLKTDTDDIDEILDILNEISSRISDSLASKQTGFRTLTMKVRYSDFTTVTRSLTVRDTIVHNDAILKLIPRLLDATEAGYREVRLVGLSASNLVALDAPSPRQLELPFPPPLKVNRDEIDNN
ncbi:MAG: DNA polymerase IV [Desulfobulbia bacterium]